MKSLNDPQPAFRLTSIESLDGVSNQVRQIASNHGFELEIQQQTTLNAPFCGIDYYYQDMKLIASVANGDSKNGRLDRCLFDIEQLAETSFADGFVEIIE